MVALEVGHIPLKMYSSVCEALAWTIGEKLNPLDKKFAPGREAAVTSLAVVVTSCAHVPFPVVLVFEGVNLHSADAEDVEQDPVYTDISPLYAIVGVNAVLSLATNGRLEVIVSD